MLKILLVIFFILFILYVISNSKKSPYRLIMIFGKKGSGKSTYFTKLAKRYIKKGFPVYTNMVELNYPGVRFFHVSDLGVFVPEEGSVLLIDEAGSVYDNRNYKGFAESTRDFYKLQRHYKCRVYLASQSFDVDKKLRDLTDEMYLLQNFGWISVARKIRRKIVLVEASAMGESRIADNLKFCGLFSNDYIWCPRYRKYFNSFVVPAKPLLKYMIKDMNRYPEGCEIIDPNEDDKEIEEKKSE